MSNAICMAYSGVWVLAEVADKEPWQISKLVIGGLAMVVVLPAVFWSAKASSAVLGLGVFWLGWLVYGVMLPDVFEQAVIAELGVMHELVGCVLYAGPVIAAGVWGVVGEGEDVVAVKKVGSRAGE